jgi:hypothetical protein
MQRSTAALTGFFALWATAATAQTILKAGVTSSSISFDGDESFKFGRRSGFVAGLAVMPSGSDRGGWQFEAIVVQKGVRNLLQPGDAARFTYLEFPVLTHMDFWQHRNNAAYFTAGPSIAFRLASSYEVGGIRGVALETSPVDVGLNAGIGLEIGALVIDARSNWGMRSAFKRDGIGVEQRTLWLTAGIRFR